MIELIKTYLIFFTVYYYNLKNCWVLNYIVLGLSKL